MIKVKNYFYIFILVFLSACNRNPLFYSKLDKKFNKKISKKESYISVKSYIYGKGFKNTKFYLFTPNKKYLYSLSRNCINLVYSKSIKNDFNLPDFINTRIHTEKEFICNDSSIKNRFGYISIYYKNGNDTISYNIIPCYRDTIYYDFSDDIIDLLHKIDSTTLKSR